MLTVCVQKNENKEREVLGGSADLVVIGGDSRSRGCRFKSPHLLLYGHFWHPVDVIIVMFGWKKRK